MIFPTHIVAAGGLVFGKDKRILLVKSPRRGWEFPGGQVEAGESLPQALIREIQEESGVTAKVMNIVGIYSNTSKRKGYDGVTEIPTIVNIDFLCEYVSGDLKTSPESVDVGWFNKDEASDMITYPLNRHRFQNMIGFNGDFHCDAFKAPFDIFEQYVFNR